jgi:enamine deaminase RidA (YjgF/YER057c/UK114 family)
MTARNAANEVEPHDIKRIETLPRLSRAVVHNGIVYLSGQLADDPNVPVEEQTRNILQKLDGYLEQAGSDKTRVLSAVVWLKDIADAPRMNSVWESWMPAGFAPSRSCVQSVPGRPEFSVEITLTAALR